MIFKSRYVINTHKATTIPFIVALMFHYENFGIGPYVYLALHGTYCILWLLKELYFPDKAWDQPLHPAMVFVLYIILGPCGYWIAPTLLIRNGTQPSPPMIALAIFVFSLGVFFHFCGDCQKFFTLKYRKGLIQEGLFSQSRNINYLGEIFIYLAFNSICQHWLPFLAQACFIAFIFYPNMIKKERSLSRYEEFKIYKARTWLLFPKCI